MYDENILTKFFEILRIVRSWKSEKLEKIMKCHTYKDDGHQKDLVLNPESLHTALRL